MFGPFDQEDEGPPIGEHLEGLVTSEGLEVENEHTDTESEEEDLITIWLVTNWHG